MQCQCLTAKKLQCKNRARPNTVYCHLHEQCAYPLSTTSAPEANNKSITRSPISSSIAASTSTAPTKATSTSTTSTTATISTPNAVALKECVGWRECGHIVSYRGIDVWELPENTVLFKGVRPNERDTENEYIEDVDYLPDDFTFLAGNLATAGIYGWSNMGRIIALKTTKMVRLLDFSSETTLKYVFENCGDCGTLLERLFNIYKDNYKNVVRNSYKHWDYKLMEQLMAAFPWIDGYAYQPSEKSGFHEEIVIFRPRENIERYPIEYRWSGVGVGFKKFNIIIPYLLKVNRGRVDGGALIRRPGAESKGGSEFAFMGDYGNKAEFLVKTDGSGIYDLYEIDAKDRRDDAFRKLFAAGGNTNDGYYKTVTNIMIQDPSYQDYLKLFQDPKFIKKYIGGLADEAATDAAVSGNIVTRIYNFDSVWKRNILSL